VFSPVKIKLEGRLFGVMFLKLFRYRYDFCKASADSIRNGLDELFLSGSFRIVNGKDVGFLRLGLKDLLDDTRKIDHVDGRHQVFALSYVRQSFWLLEPCFF